MPWIRRHSWNTTKVFARYPGEPDRSMEDYATQYQNFRYTNESDVEMYCYYCGHMYVQGTGSGHIIDYPASKKIGEITFLPLHECPSLPPLEEDPDAIS